MVMEGDLTWGGEHTIQYTDDVLYNCTPETYIILLTNKFNNFFSLNRTIRVPELSQLLLA